MSNWTQPLCSVCWNKENPTKQVNILETETLPPVSSYGSDILLGEDCNRCCSCGMLTFAGIYVRKDPTTIPFPMG